MTKPFLFLVALGLLPIALGYGFAPKRSLEFLYGIEVTSVNETHVFRAVMGLYLAMVVFWIKGALDPRLTVPALWSVVVFMLGLAAGRSVSLVLDGMPHGILFAYLILELICGLLALRLLGIESRRADAPA